MKELSGGTIWSPYLASGFWLTTDSRAKTTELRAKATHSITSTLTRNYYIKPQPLADAGTRDGDVRQRGWGRVSCKKMSHRDQPCRLQRGLLTSCKSVYIVTDIYLK